jgi:hypothetical protein
MSERVMTLDEFVESAAKRAAASKVPSHFDGLGEFATAYRKGMKRDPTQFPASGDWVHWVMEFNLWEDVGGDAEAEDAHPA